ncbi:MAG: hypothetical protein KatS3mg118_1922 [Paracoccaceae bacterium]|nr:MAG: pilus assembly protein [Alphaproteobacteria bacterium]GIX13963.1 MAG: hypothetical protein KatS3mg118_1922 [Paracoccaceae bacterium]
MRGLGALAWFRDRLSRFGAETRGAVTVEFVVALPLLLGVLAFAVQYGYAMQVRNALDVAVRDAARYLSRAPVDPITHSVDPAFLDKAVQLVNDRISDAAVVEVNDLVVRADMVAVKATATVDLPLLQVIGWFSGDDTAQTIAMVSCEGWAVSESRDAGGVLAQQLSGEPFRDCPDASLVAMVSP